MISILFSATVWGQDFIVALSSLPRLVWNCLSHQQVTTGHTYLDAQTHRRTIHSFWLWKNKRNVLYEKCTRGKENICIDWQEMKCFYLYSLYVAHQALCSRRRNMVKEEPICKHTVRTTDQPWITYISPTSKPSSIGTRSRDVRNLRTRLQAHYPLGYGGSSRQRNPIGENSVIWAVLQ